MIRGEPLRTVPVAGIEALDSVVPSKKNQKGEVTSAACEIAVAQALPEMVMALLFGRRVMVNSSYATDSPTAIQVLGSILNERPSIDEFDWPKHIDGWWMPSLAQTPYHPFNFGGVGGKSYSELLYGKWASSREGAFHSSAWGGDDDAMRRTLEAAESARSEASVLHDASEMVARQIDRLPVGFTIGQLHAVANEYNLVRSEYTLQDPDFNGAPSLGNAITWLASLSEPLAIRNNLDPADAMRLRSAASALVEYASSIGAWKPALARTLCHSPEHVGVLSSAMEATDLAALREFVDTCYNHVVNQSLGVPAPMMSEPVAHENTAVLDAGERAAYRWIAWTESHAAESLREPEQEPDPPTIAYPSELTNPVSLAQIAKTVWEVLASKEWYQSFSRVHEADYRLEQRSGEEPEPDEMRAYDEQVQRHAEVVADLITKHGRGYIWGQQGSVALALKRTSSTTGSPEAAATAHLSGIFFGALQPVAGVLTLTAGVARSLAIAGDTGGRTYDRSVRRRRLQRATKAYADHRLVAGTWRSGPPDPLD